MHNDWKTRLQQEFNENPLQTIGILTLAVTAAAKALESLSGVRSRNAYAKRMNRRD